jgi:inosine-uridine nucleoside N-ribohydrolase
MEKINIHYDCDTGQDDAIALLYALGSDRINVKSISVVGGNIDVDQCARNTLQILELANRSDIPLYKGSSEPLVRKLKTLPEIFGQTGMAGGEDLPVPVMQPIDLHFAHDSARFLSNDVIVATGPLTNIAQMIQSNKNFASSLKHLLVMGGNVYPDPINGRMGNMKIEGTDEFAEYNFYADPEAAEIVFSAGIEKITLVGLDVTRTVLYNKHIEQLLINTGKKCAIRSAKILSSVGKGDVVDGAELKGNSFDPVRALHDVVAMVCLDTPEIFKFENLPIKIIVGGDGVPSGQSLIDYDNPSSPNVRVAVSVNKDEFYKKFIETIAQLP